MQKNLQQFRYINMLLYTIISLTLHHFFRLFIHFYSLSMPPHTHIHAHSQFKTTFSFCSSFCHRRHFKLIWTTKKLWSFHFRNKTSLTVNNKQKQIYCFRFYLNRLPNMHRYLYLHKLWSYVIYSASCLFSGDLFFVCICLWNGVDEI